MAKKRRSRSTKRVKANKVRRLRDRRACSNREIRNAINILGGYVHGGRTSPARAAKAAQAIGSCDLISASGRRGGVSSNNTIAGLRLLAAYEKKTRKKLRRLGGFSRKAVNAAKRYASGNPDI